MANPPKISEAAKEFQSGAKSGLLQEMKNFNFAIAEVEPKLREVAHQTLDRFDTLDGKKDGVIHRSSFKKAFEDMLGKSDMKLTPADKKKIEANFAQLPETMTANHAAVNEVIKSSLLKIDRNHDWKITFDEIKSSTDILPTVLPKLIGGLPASAIKGK